MVRGSALRNVAVNSHTPKGVDAFRRGDAVGGRAVVKQSGRLAVSDDNAELMCSRTRIDRHTHQTSALDSTLQNDIVGAISHQHDDAFTGCDLATQSTGKAICRSVEFREGPALLAITKRNLACVGARSLRHQRARGCTEQARFRHVWSL